MLISKPETRELEELFSNPETWTIFDCGGAELFLIAEELKCLPAYNHHHSVTMKNNLL
jgi:hypothetical protein